MSNDPIDPQVYDLYDEYCHSDMSRRSFLSRAAALTLAAGSGLIMAQSLLPRYAEAETISFTDDRIKANYVHYDSPGGTSGKMRGYLVQPSGDGPFPAVVVIHENRGLNPYIEDVARRLAVAGFLALAPDGLSPVGGYPGNDDDGKQLQASLDQGKLFTDMLNSAYFVKRHALSTGKLGTTGFCYGGGVVNQLAVTMRGDLNAAAPFYGRPANSQNVPAIQAPLVIHFAEDDPRINAMSADYKAALTANNKDFAMYQYQGTRHGFHNDSTPRFNQQQADLAWERTLDLFQQQLT
ncbi:MULTISPECIES: dienelactone hydrolase family protein [unclassified Oceanobacter]|uniref:dienelactone hydrolase family protein n=1 Tax=unclassified Oceanobacter TaxID=2620260 RepID=UPI00273675EF|nr:MULTISPECIES: dienelactone hydrolase family protein [unclassified Oceanobacter]MDP2608988.1 dienelactone hydrolase family protein [Oceanobacter sp. 1_MG-2023]MDP2612027.1 dienelactone hydrolase family protein [Oceanobacter sp. 2_MG-2023]